MLVEGGLLVLRGAHGFEDAMRPAPPRPVADSPTGRAVLTGRVHASSDLAADPHCRQTRVLTELGYRALLQAPVLLRGEAVGVLSALQKGPRVFSPDEVGVVMALAEAVAVALEKRPLRGALRARLRETETLLSVSQAVSTTLDLTEVLRRVAREMARALGADTVGAFLADADERVLRPIAGYHVPPELRDADGEFPIPLRGHPLFEEAWTLGRPIAAMDVATDPRLSPALRARLRARSLLFVPMVAKEAPIGGLLLAWWAEAPPLSAPELRLVEGIGRQAGLAVANARLFAVQQEDAEVARALLTLAEATGALQERGRVLDTVARVTPELLGLRRCGVFLWDAAAARLVPTAAWGLAPALAPAFAALAGRPPVPAVVRAIESREPVVVDATAIPAHVRESLDVRSVLVLPLVASGRLMGTMAVDSPGMPHVFTSKQIAIARGIAAQAAVAIQNAALYAETERRRRTAEELAEVGRLLSETLDPDVVGQRIADGVRTLLGVRSATLYRLDDGAPAQCHALGISGEPFPRGTGIVRAAVAARQPVVTPDVLADPRATASPEVRAALEHSESRAVLAVPLTVKDRVIGVLALADRTGRAFDPEAAGLAQLFAGQAAVALENARLFQAHQRELEQLSVLYELSHAVTGQLDLGELVRTVQRQIGRVLDARNMVLFLFDQSRREFTTALRMFDGRPDPNPVDRYPMGVGLMSRVAERRQPIRTTDYAAACRAEGVQPVPTSLTLPHWLGVPLIAGDEILGVVALRDAARPFTDDDERLLTNIAGVVGLAMRAARLFAETTRAHDELRAAQDQLIRSEKLRALGEMAAGVAHDFNNVLAAIMGRAQLLLAQIEEPGHRRQLQIIERAAMDGAHTVRRIQGFTRTRRDRPFEPVDLNQVIEEVVEVTRSRWKDDAAAKGLTYDVRVEPVPLPWVAADPAELREVVTNLVLNALDAMPDGGRLTLATGVEGETVICTVTDTGIGMTEAVRQRVFDPFFTTKAEKGTGLGLSMAYGIVTRHGGEIEARSQPWQGSTFIIRFPVARPAAPVADRAGAPPPVGPARVLIIEDEENVRHVLAELLMAEGHTVAAHADGRSGLARFHDEPFDVVFTDLGLPGLSGWEVARLVKLRRPATPIVLVTGWSEQIEPEDVRGRGVDFVVAKPFEAATIRRVLADALAARRS